MAPQVLDKSFSSIDDSCNDSIAPKTISAQDAVLSPSFAAAVESVDKRKDRYETIKNQFNDIGLDDAFFFAKQHTRGALCGCCDRLMINSSKTQLEISQDIPPENSPHEGIEATSIFAPDPKGRPGIDHTLDTVPAYLRRLFILRGYRAHLTLERCFWSLFSIHNELFDCWSHGLAALFFVFMSVYAPLYLVTHFRFPIVIFCASHAVVFSVSFLAHTFNPVNEIFHLRCFQLDWSAIAFAILGVGISAVCYCFYCDEFKIKLYTGLLAVPCMTLFGLANTHWFHRQGEVRKSLVALLPVPAAVWIYIDALHNVEDLHRLEEVAMSPFLVAGVGLLIYATKVPERWFPGRFDFILNSHNIHHVWTTAVAVLMLQNLIKWSQIREETVCAI